MRKLLLIILSVLMLPLAASAQILVTDNEPIEEDSIKRDFSNQPYFGLYKDNYFIFGPSLQRPDKSNTNVKFQISISQRLTRSTLPWGTYLYLFYTQKCFWNILENSLPMTDLNFNPGIGIAKPFFAKNRYIGKLLLILEHESNGRDGDASRSWNRVAVASNIMLTRQLNVYAKAWIPIVDGMNNKDIVDYCGWCHFGTQFRTPNGRFLTGLAITPLKGWRANTVVDVAYRIFKRDNQYLFLQFYQGYGEGLLEYNRYHIQARVGLLISPKLFSEY